MIAAFVEWFMWLAAFMYCLVKVFQKAEHWSVKVLAVVVAIVFTLLRYVLEFSPIYNPALIKFQQMYFPAHHGCYTPSAKRNHSILPFSDGNLPSMVRILVVRRPLDSPMAVLRISIGHTLARPDKAHQAGSG